MLVFVCRFGVEVSRYATVVSQRDTNVKEGYVSTRVWSGEFNGGVNVVKIIDAPHKDLTCEAKNLIYMIQCNRCNLQYIGETKRRLKDRLNDHHRTIDNPNSSRESVVNHDESRHSIMSYRNPNHWLRENYEFKTTFGTNRIRGIESAIASTIMWERRQRTLRENRNICQCFVSVVSELLGFIVDVGKWGTWVSFFHFPKFVMNFLKGVVSLCHSFRNTGQPGMAE